MADAGQSSALTHPQAVTRTFTPENETGSTVSMIEIHEGQRNEVVERKLAEAFTPGSFRADPALRFFLDIIRTCIFYLKNGHEPLLGTSEAGRLLAKVRSRYPDDPRFARRSDSRSASQPVDDETGDSLSIFILFTNHNQCLICGAQKDRTVRVLAHVRSDIEHKPYRCRCDKCKQSPRYVLFLV